MATNIRDKKRVYVGNGAPTDGDQLTLNDSAYPLDSVYVDGDTGSVYVRKDVSKVAATDWALGSGGGSETTYSPTSITFTRIFGGFTVETPETGVKTYNNPISSASIDGSDISVNINGNTFYNFNTSATITVNGTPFSGTAAELKTLLYYSIFSNNGVASGGGVSLVYTALLIAAPDGDTPTVMVLRNTLGGEVTWSYHSIGDYRGLLPDVPAGVAVCHPFGTTSGNNTFLPVGNSVTGFLGMSPNSSNEIVVQLFDNLTDFNNIDFTTVDGVFAILVNYELFVS